MQSHLHLADSSFKGLPPAAARVKELLERENSLALNQLLDGVRWFAAIKGDGGKVSIAVAHVRMYLADGAHAAVSSLVACTSMLSSCDASLDEKATYPPVSQLLVQVEHNPSLLTVKVRSAKGLTVGQVFDTVKKLIRMDFAAPTGGCPPRSPSEI
jgi:hypothetical protein